MCAGVGPVFYRCLLLPSPLEQPVEVEATRLARDALSLLPPALELSVDGVANEATQRFASLRCRGLPGCTLPR